MLIAVTTAPTSAVTPRTCFARMDRAMGGRLYSGGKGEGGGAGPAEEGGGGQLPAASGVLRSYDDMPLRSPSRFNLLCSVFRLMPRISAARVLLSRGCSRGT